MQFKTTYSHLFPGSSVTVIEDGWNEGTCQVLLGDGAAVLGICAKQGNEWTLEMPPYISVAGSKIKARTWRIVFERKAWKVRATS